MQDPDELWSMRNQYYVGNFDGVFSEAESVHVDVGDALFAEKNLFLQLARLAQGDELERLDSSLSSRVEFKALSILFQLKLGNEEALLKSMMNLVDEDVSKNARLRWFAATALIQCNKDPNEALRVLFPVKSKSLEVQHLCVFLYLQMDRIDLASRAVEEMKQMDEDSTLCQLSVAMLGLLGDKQESVDIYRELMSKWVASPYLASGLSSALIGQGKFEEAMEGMEDVEEKSSELYLNSICAFQHMGKRLDEHIGGLKQLYSNHVWFREMAEQSLAFDQAAAKFE